MIKKYFKDLGEIYLHKGFKRYLKNTSWMFLEQTLRMVSAFLVGVLIVRHLGPENFGILSYVLALSGIFGCIAKLGLDGVLTRELVGNPSSFSTYLGTAFWMKMIGAVISTIAILFYLKLSNQSEVIIIYSTIIISGLYFQSFEVIDFYFQSKVEYKYISLCKSIQLVISSLIKIYLVFINGELYLFFLVATIDQITLAFLLLFAYYKDTKINFYNKFSWELSKKLIQDSWPLIITSISITLYMRVDQVILENMLGNSDVGLYTAAVKLSEVWYFVPTIITSSLFPAMINSKKESIKKYEHRVASMYKLLLWISIIIAILVEFLSDDVINLLYGSQYLESSRILKVLIWNGIVVAIGSVWSRWILVENKQKLGIYQIPVSAFLNITLCVFFVNEFGLIGAAYATLISNVIGQQIFFSLFERKKTYKFLYEAIKFWKLTK